MRLRHRTGRRRSVREGERHSSVARSRQVRSYGVNAMRWRHVAVGLALLGTALSGCKQQCFIYECDYKTHIQGQHLPVDLDTNPAYGSILAAPAANSIAPTDVNNPEREIRYISLSEAIAIALERGTIGQGFNGLPNDILIGLDQGRGQANSIRVLSLDQAIHAADF